MKKLFLFLEVVDAVEAIEVVEAVEVNEAKVVISMFYHSEQLL